MSAETLREAAALMRSRAEAATGSPEFSWLTSPTEGGWHAVMGEEYGDDVAVSGSASNAEHIASWHPAVALAVADLLTVFSMMPSASDPTDMAVALHLAETYLGGAA